MAELKTKKTKASVAAFIREIENDRKRADSKVIVEMMKDVTGERPAMWGPSIVGFGTYRYRYESGREADWFLTGFSPRKQSLVLYIMPGFSRYGPLLKKLGKHKTGQSCLYINKLADVDTDVLRELVAASVAHARKKSVAPA